MIRHGIALGALLLAVGCACGLAGETEMKTDFWVAPDGSDQNAGTKEKPFATLERARDAVRDLKNRSGLPKGGITVWLRGGAHERAKTFELGKEDSGTAEAPVVYRAVAGEEVRISGGRRIPASAFKPVDDAETLPRLDPAARGKVLAADLKALGLADFGQMQARGGTNHGLVTSGLEIFFNDRPMTLARWPNQGFAVTGKILDSGMRVLAPGDPSYLQRDDPSKHRGTFAFADDRIKRWAKAEDMWLHGYYCWDWSDEYLPVQSVDAEKQQITLGRAHHYGLKEGKRFYVLNLLEELDQTGEWYLDRKAGILYFWPPEPLERAGIVVSILAEPIILLKEASHLIFRGLTIEAGRASGVRILGGSDNLIAGCAIRNLGTVGVHIGEGFNYGNTVHDTKGGLRNGVQSCDIYNTGEGGIILAGGDRKTLAPAGNFAVNNNIHDFSRIARTNHVAVDMAGVGNRVAHNWIHHGPHIGVFFWGNDHVMEYNEVYSVCQETADAGAFYIGRDFSMRGNVLRHNFIHDIGRFAGAKEFGGTMAVYLDDWASGTTVYGNVVANVHIGVMIGGGHDNIVENNLWVNCGHTAVHVDARGLGWAKSNFDGRDPTLFDRLKAVNYKQPPYSQRYPELARVLDGNPAEPKGNRVARNVCSGGRWTDFHDGMNEQKAGVADNLVLPDAGFVNAAKGDFQLKDDSPAYKIPGFQKIPFEEIGIFKDEYRPGLTTSAEGKQEKTTHPDAQWFPQAKMGLFLHWGIHSVAGIQPSWAMIKDYPAGGDKHFHPPEKYFTLAEQFNPKNYDPDKWLAAAAKAGFSYAVLTTKHHDGYTMWPSRFGDFGTQRYMAGRDLVRPFVEACRKNGLKVGIYFSFADWHYPRFPITDVGFDFNKRDKFSPISADEDQKEFEKFYAFTRGQLQELLTGYGKIDLLWFDGVGWPHRNAEQMQTAEIMAWIRSLQPGIVINDRWMKTGDYTTPECDFPKSRPDGWWEACYCTNGHWGYNPGKPLPDVSWFIQMRNKCNQWGGNFLPNIGPKPDGTMPDDFYVLCDKLAAAKGK
ncbi:MAG: alpha-L-fucosidase [Planctomycetota bacterium]